MVYDFGDSVEINYNDINKKIVNTGNFLTGVGLYDKADKLIKSLFEKTK